MISLDKKVSGEWKNEDLLKVKEVYVLTLKKERLLLSQGQLNYLERGKVADLTQDVNEFDGLIAKLTEDIHKSNPLMIIKPLRNGEISTITFQDLNLLLTEKANEDIDYWPAHFSDRKEYMEWLNAK